MTERRPFVLRAPDFGFHSSFVIRHSLSRAKGALAFTILELLIVMTIIIILAGLTIATMGYAQNKSRRSRAEAEIAAISAACENYKADNGVYPSDAKTDALAPNSAGDPTAAGYKDASLALYKLISGDADNDASRVAEAKSYFSFKPNQLFPDSQTSAVTFIRDPFSDKSGKPCSYGYSTAKASNPAGTAGYNPTFDLWSTAGTNTTPADQSQWIKNW